MVVNIVINSIIESKLGYRDEEFYIPVLFYADDGLLLARSCEEDRAALQGEIGASTVKGRDMKKGSHLRSICLELGIDYWRVYLER